MMRGAPAQEEGLVVPTFLIVGAARSGTTSLHHWLSSHPDVFVSQNKEPSYFVHSYGFSDWNRYLALFQAGRGKRVVGEASTAYMSAPESPAWIRRVLGDVKIIILLRNPVERAWSLYSWMVMEGYEWVPTFERALVEEERRVTDVGFQRKNPQYFWNYMYFRSGLYHHHVQEYLRLFGHDRVRIHLFEDLVEDAGVVYADVCKFLDIDVTFRPVLRPQNASRRPRLTGLQFLLRRWWRAAAREYSATNLRRSAIAALMAANVRYGGRGRLHPTTANVLKDRYASDVQRLGALIGRDCEHWLADPARIAT